MTGHTETDRRSRERRDSGRRPPQRSAGGPPEPGACGQPAAFLPIVRRCQAHYLLERSRPSCRGGSSEQVALGLSPFAIGDGELVG